MKAAIAVTRFGMGAKPGEIAEARQDPKGFLSSEIPGQGAAHLLGEPIGTAQRMAEFRDYRRERREVRIEKAAEVRPAAAAGTAVDRASPAMADAAPNKPAEGEP